MRVININHPRCEARVAVRGAQLLSFTPREGHDLLWCTDKAFIRDDKPIRGGIPICWPWFGAHPSDASLPQHGFARLQDWQLLSSEALEEHHELIFELRSNPDTLAMWPHEFKARVVMELGSRCKVTLLVNTTGEWTGALHTYLACDDIGDVEVSGLGNLYQDNLADGALTAGSAITKLVEPTERLYLAPDPITVLQQANGDQTILAHNGHSDIMLWTPWTNAGRQPADMPAEGYKRMVCIETSRIQCPQTSGHLEVGLRASTGANQPY